MTSDRPSTAFVWIWLPDASSPIVAGRVDRVGDRYVFRYGRSYLERPVAVPIYGPELPLDDRPHEPLDGTMPLCLDDAAPDSWGRAVINAQRNEVGAELDSLVYLLESGSDRVGAIDFQASAADYVPRAPVHAPLDQLIHAADIVASGEPLDRDLADALLNGTPLGGARPKALIDDDGTKLLAKFSMSTDTFPWPEAEYIAMELARRAGLDVAPVRYVQTMSRGVLLVERFDRPDGRRRRVVSAATVLGLQAVVAARHFTYMELADEIRRRFVQPDATLRELFSRIMFNILVGNTDDHARNHAAFVLADEMLALTPAYDIAPQPRIGETARHPAFGPGASGRDSRTAALVDAADVYHLARSEALDIADRQRDVIVTDWDEVADQARVNAAQRSTLMGGPFLNPYSAYPDSH